MKDNNRKYRPLTTMEINSFKPRDKVYKMGHGGGLYIMVYPNGNKLWGMKYYVDGKERRTSFGSWPQVSIVDAQKKRDEIKGLLAQGIDPAQHKKEAKEKAKLETSIPQNTFQVVATDWLNAYGKDLVATRFIKLKRYLENELFPAFGHKPVTEIVPADILAVAEKKQEAGKVYTAHRLTQLSGQILQYAFIKGLVTINVGKGITAALQPVRHKNFSTITDPKEIGRLLRSIYAYNGFYSITYYLKILPYLFCRPGELRLAEWQEIDFERAILTIPSKRLKTRKISPVDHIIPLATQVIALFKELQQFSGNNKFVFPSIRAKTDTISDAGPLNALRDMGYTQEQITLHGFRHMASTRLNEMGFKPDVIETQLAHKDRNIIRGTYNKAEYIKERTEMMQSWADFLDTLRAGNTVGL